MTNKTPPPAYDSEPPKIDRTNNYYISRELYEDYKRMWLSKGSELENERVAKELERLWPEIVKLIQSGFPLTIYRVLQSILKIEPEQTPCDTCGTLIATDVHKEELGFCLTCSDKYWNHEDEQ